MNWFGIALWFVLTTGSLLVQGFLHMWFASEIGGPYPAGMALNVGVFFGGPTVAVAFLISLIAGLKRAVRMAGWTLLPHLLFYALVLFAVCDPVPADRWTDPVISRHPASLAGLVALMGMGLLMFLVRTHVRPPTRGAGGELARSAFRP